MVEHLFDTHKKFDTLHLEGKRKQNLNGHMTGLSSYDMHENRCQLWQERL